MKAEASVGSVTCDDLHRSRSSLGLPPFAFLRGPCGRSGARVRRAWLGTAGLGTRLQSAQWHVATKIGRPCPASVSFLHVHVTDHSDITSVAVAWTVVNPELGA